jgi:hypothetical protein
LREWLTSSKVTLSKTLREHWKISEDHFTKFTFSIFTYGIDNSVGGIVLWKKEWIHVGKG